MNATVIAPPSAAFVFVGTACAAAYLALLAFKTTLALRYVRGYPRHVRGAALAVPASTSVPAAGNSVTVDLSAATVVQPILSGDPDLAAALADNLAALPESRFLWLVDIDDREAEQITARLARDHPAHRIERCVCPPPPPGINPKLFKLERARDRVTDGAFVVLDDDTRLTREGVTALLAALETETLATGLPCYLERDGLPSRLLAQFVNNNAALTYLPLLSFAAPVTINGMTYAITPASLAALGGFAPLWGHLADDLAVARRVLQTGGTIRQTPFPQFVATSVRDLRHYRALMHRWFVFALLLLRAQRPGWQALITVLHGLPPMLLSLTLLGAIAAPGRRTAIAAAGLLAVRAITLIAVQRTITGRSRHAFALSILSELLQPLHLLHALCSRRIVWRTRCYTVRANDDFRPCASHE